VHTAFEFDFETGATPEQVIGLMTDFSPERPNNWPALSARTYQVIRVNDTDADVREGQDFPKLQATWHYDWSTPGSVTLTVVDGDAIASGSYMAMTATPTAGGGSSVHVTWDQTSKNVTGLLGVAVMRVIGRRFLASYYKRVYDGLI
jgi:hypothetical protein